MEIPEKRANFILEQFDHDIEELAACLTVSNDNKKLILLNPEYMRLMRESRQNRLNSISYYQRNSGMQPNNNNNTINLSSS